MDCLGGCGTRSGNLPAASSRDGRGAYALYICAQLRFQDLRPETHLRYQDGYLEYDTCTTSNMNAHDQPAGTDADLVLIEAGLPLRATHKYKLCALHFFNKGSQFRL